MTRQHPGPKNSGERNRDKDKDQKNRHDALTAHVPSSKKKARKNSSNNISDTDDDFNNNSCWNADDNRNRHFQNRRHHRSSPFNNADMDFDSEAGVDFENELGNDPDDVFDSKRKEPGFSERAFGDSTYSTERFDPSTHTDQMNRATSIENERAILVGVFLPKQGRQESPLDELAGLAKAADVLPLARLIQRRQTPDFAFYLGKGKVDELEQLVRQYDANVILFDNDLAPNQTRNLERRLKVKVIDRTELILDIFASRARTHEARLAVELAQLEYSLPRLARMWTHLERQTGGGVGLRGPGEKQLEVDRRIAQKRIAEFKQELEQIHNRKKREVEGRKWSRRVCLVGYTNVGKSTLLNRMTHSDVYVQDLLFATLDTRTRRWFLPGWGPVLLSDTVGFIRDLPPHLIASFRATLEEATSADLLIHVADASSPEVGDQIASAYRILDDLGIREKDTLLVLNKVDAVPSPDILRALQDKYPTAVSVSALDGEGIERLTAAVSESLSREFLELFIEAPVANGRLAAQLARDGEILSREYSGERVIFHCRLPQHILGKVQKEDGIVIHPGSPDAPPLVREEEEF